MIKQSTCIERLKERAIHHKEEDSYYTNIDGKWISLSWHDYHHEVRRFAKALIAVGAKKQSKVSILGSNTLRWVISAIGAQYMGGVSVGIYTASSKEEVFYVVEHSDTQILVVQDMACYEAQVKDNAEALSKLNKIVLMSDEEFLDENHKLIKYSDFIRLGDKISDSELNSFSESIDPQSVATMIYTSGTTGNPKSVMLSHNSIAWTVRTAVQSWRCGSWDTAVSYLPLAHVAEQMFTLYAPIECGLRQYFTPSFDQLKETLKDVEPTVFFGVPRVYEKMQEAIKEALNEKGILGKSLISYLSSITSNFHSYHNIGKIPGLWTNVQYNFLAKKLFTKLKKALGFTNIRICVSGAAPIAKDVLQFFSGLDITIYEVYGQSENAGPASFNLVGETKLGSVGKAMPGSKIKIADDGEILIKGPHVFLGYYKDEEASKEAIKDGWLYTGDVGYIDRDGFLTITDRKKDILITAGGKNVSPQNLESMLKSIPYVQSAVVIGDRRRYLCALLSPDMESIKKKFNHINEELVQQEIKLNLDNINKRLAPVEQIKKFSLLPNEFSIDSGEFTPTLKIKRKFVNQKYKEQIEKMYS